MPVAAEDRWAKLLPEEKQSASLQDLEHEVQPSSLPRPLYQAASSVENAGRMLEAWVKRRQVVAEAFPALQQMVSKCQHKAKDMEAAVQGELADASGKQSPVMLMLDPPSTISSKRLAAARTFFNVTGTSDAAVAPVASGKPLKKGAAAAQQPEAPVSGAAKVPAPAAAKDASKKASAVVPDKVADASGSAEAKKTGGQEPDKDQPRSAEELQRDFQQFCAEYRTPPSFTAARMAASQAYWDFDRSLDLAQRNVIKALELAGVQSA